MVERKGCRCRRRLGTPSADATLRRPAAAAGRRRAAPHSSAPGIGAWHPQPQSQLSVADTAPAGGCPAGCPQEWAGPAATGAATACGKGAGPGAGCGRVGAEASCGECPLRHSDAGSRLSTWCHSAGSCVGSGSPLYLTYRRSTSTPSGFFSILLRQAGCRKCIVRGKCCNPGCAVSACDSHAEQPTGCRCCQARRARRAPA